MTQREAAAFGLCRFFWGTKIAGVPHQSAENLDAAPADYLCQLVSIDPSSDTLWPWADREALLTSGFDEGGTPAVENNLMIGDVGEVTFYLRNLFWILWRSSLRDFNHV